MTNFLYRRIINKMKIIKQINNVKKRKSLKSNYRLNNESVISCKSEMEFMGELRVAVIGACFTAGKLFYYKIAISYCVDFYLATKCSVKYKEMSN